MKIDRNAALVRQAIFHVLDGKAWNFENDEQRVDFADAVVAWLPSAMQSETARICPSCGRTAQPYCDLPECGLAGTDYTHREALADLKSAPMALDRKQLEGVSHALRSYQYGNASPDLAKQWADEIDAALSSTHSAGGARVGLPLLYNIVCLWAQKKDDEWFKDMAELMRLADRLLYEQGYEVSPYTTNEHQIAADSATSSASAAPMAECPDCGKTFDPSWKAAEDEFFRNLTDSRSADG